MESGSISKQLHSTKSTEKITELVINATKFKILMQAVKHDIFYHASSSEGITTKILQDKCSYDVAVSEKLLNSLVNMGFLYKQRGGNDEEIFRNTDEANLHLRKDSNTSLVEWLLLKEETNDQIDRNLGDVLLNGVKSTFFNDIHSKKETANRMQSVMRYIDGTQGYYKMAESAILQAVDFNSHRNIVDVGGNSGYLGRGLIEKYPSLEVTVFDLPDVISMVTAARDFIPNNKLKYVSGDFFEDELPAGDLIIFSHVLFNWSDSHVKQLLKKAVKSLAKGGSILILEKCLSDDRTEPDFLVGINLIFSAIHQPGRARTVSEYTSFLKEQGLTEVRFQPIGGLNLYDIIEGKRL